MKTTLTETHKREVYAYIDRHELNRLLAQHVGAAHDIDVADKAVEFKVDYTEETEGSPAYRVGMAAKVTVTVDLTPGNHAALNPTGAA